MLWARRSSLAVGFGVEQRWPAQDALQRLPGNALAQREGGVLVGVALFTGERSQLTWQAELARNADSGGVALPERQMRLGLNFRAQDKYADLRRGALMRVELSGPMVLSLKPRRGQLAVTLNSKW